MLQTSVWLWSCIWWPHWEKNGGYGKSSARKWLFSFPLECNRDFLLESGRGFPWLLVDYMDTGSMSHGLPCVQCHITDYHVSNVTCHSCHVIIPHHWHAISSLYHIIVMPHQRHATSSMSYNYGLRLFQPLFFTWLMIQFVWSMLVRFYFCFHPELV